MQNRYSVILGIATILAAQSVWAEEKGFTIPQVSGVPVEDKGPLDGEFMIQMQHKRSAADYQQNVLSDQAISDIARTKKITGNGGNTAVVVQNGKENSSDIVQEGDGNDIYVNQEGERNISEEKQTGDNNKKTVIQNKKKTVSPLIEQVEKDEDTKK